MLNSMGLVDPPEENVISARDGDSEPGWRGKRVFDFICAAVLLFLLLPILCVCLVVVRLTSKGPAFYSQMRLGLGGRAFRIYKIRSMVNNCERDTGPRWAATDDPRVTPFGKFLRASHLDEIPQLWNVLCGDMSLVGPRPERPEIAVGLEREIRLYNCRLDVRPGITGLAQVQLPPDTDLESVRRKVACDLHYVVHSSAWLDLRIAFGTFLYLSGLPVVRARAIAGCPRWEELAEQYRDLVAAPEPRRSESEREARDVESASPFDFVDDFSPDAFAAELMSNDDTAGSFGLNLGGPGASSALGSQHGASSMKSDAH